MWNIVIWCMRISQNLDFSAIARSVVIILVYREYDYRPNWTTRSLITNYITTKSMCAL